MGKEYNRGAFKYLTVYIPKKDHAEGGFWHNGMPPPKRRRESWYWKGQQFLGISHESEPEVTISKVWVNCTAFPSNPNGRAYTGYFDSSSSLLDRIWYAGAWTLQLSTLDPKEGGALIDVNRNLDHNKSPTGAWYSNFTISNGTAVTTDGAKRDRMVWPGDMSIAVPGIAVSTYDMLAVRNALDTLFDHQYGDGSLPYAGPPMAYGQFSDTYHLHTLLGAYNYVLYSGDIEWLRKRWPAYLTALDVSIGKVDEFNLLHVSSTADWLRPGMTGHNVEASTILFDVLLKSTELASWLGEKEGARLKEWTTLRERLEEGIETLYCPAEGLFADNKGRRGCSGPEKVLPQDGNSWILLSNFLRDERRLNVSENLRSRWGKYGAPSPEFPNTISPFATSFELIGHCAAGNYDAAVELIELQWGYMLDGPGFTNSTLAEGYRVDGDAQYPAYWSSARNSHAHGWSTGPTTVLMQEILGIKLLTPLGKTWVIEPHLTKWLSYAQGGFATKLGKFEVSITLMKERATGQKFEILDFSTPKGTMGQLNFGGLRTKLLKGGRFKISRALSDGLRDQFTELQVDDPMEGFVKDDEWVKPDVVEREPGVVDWVALKKNYVGSRQKEPWMNMNRVSGGNGVFNEEL